MWFKNTKEKRLTPKGAEGKGAEWGVNFRGEDEEAATSGTVPAFQILIPPFLSVKAPRWPWQWESVLFLDFGKSVLGSLRCQYLVIRGYFSLFGL